MCAIPGLDAVLLGGPSGCIQDLSSKFFLQAVFFWFVFAVEFYFASAWSLFLDRRLRFSAQQSQFLKTVPMLSSNV